MVKSAAVRTRTGMGARGNGSGGERKLASSVARAIEDDIVAAGWPIGSVFGSEPELIARYGISRAVFREAIRLVEHHHVAFMRRGHAGGLIVKAPDAAAAANAAIVYLEFVGTTVADLLQARLLLEPIAAGAAAQNLTEEGIRELRAAATSAHAEDVHGTHGNLHVKLAELSGNPALYLFVEVLARLTERYAKLRRTTKAERGQTAEEIDFAHRSIADAVISGDAGTAQHYMTSHLKAMHRWFTGTERRIASPRSTTPRRGAPDTEGRKLAEVIADAMREDIVHGGWQIGEVVGSEGDLLQRYDVSRSVLREAIRLLEHYSVARMRRGHHGGLIVTEPDPSAGVEAMALYLDYRGATAEDLLAVRKALELGCVDTVIGRADEPGIADRLRDAVEIPLGEADTRVHDLHLTLAELGGNPVLVYFLRAITSLWLRHGHGRHGENRMDPRDAVAAAEKAHSAIVKAVLAGDRGLARHRMTRHLDALPAFWH